jgi:hypothetical protein
LPPVELFRIKLFSNVNGRTYGVVHVIIPETAGTAAGKNIFHARNFFLVDIKVFQIIDCVDGVRIFSLFKVHVHY